MIFLSIEFQRMGPVVRTEGPDVCKPSSFFEPNQQIILLGEVQLPNFFLSGFKLQLPGLLELGHRIFTLNN